MRIVPLLNLICWNIKRRKWWIYKNSWLISIPFRKEFLSKQKTEIENNAEICLIFFCDCHWIVSSNSVWRSWRRTTWTWMFWLQVSQKSWLSGNSDSVFNLNIFSLASVAVMESVTRMNVCSSVLRKNVQQEQGMLLLLGKVLVEMICNLFFIW